VVFCGCSDFDDSELRGRIDGYKNRIEALKAKAETLGKQLADLSYLTNGNVITTVSQDADGKYVVTYKDNKDVEHTVVLATMDVVALIGLPEASSICTPSTVQQPSASTEIVGV